MICLKNLLKKATFNSIKDLQYDIHVIVGFIRKINFQFYKRSSQNTSRQHNQRNKRQAFNSIKDLHTLAPHLYTWYLHGFQFYKRSS